MLSQKSAASLALWLSIEQPGVFDAFVSSLPGAREVGLRGFGFLGDDEDWGGDTSAFDSLNTDDIGSEFDDGSGGFLLMDAQGNPMTEDDATSMEDLREDSATGSGYSTPVTGSAADTGNLGPVMGSSANLADQVNIDPLTSTLNANDTALAQDDVAPINVAVQGISSSKAVGSIGAPALGAASAALTSPSGLNALSNAATAYFNSQAQLGQEQTFLNQQAATLQTQIALAGIERGATATTQVLGPNGQPETVLANGSTGEPLVDPNGNLIPAATGAGILSALTSGLSGLTSGGLGPLLLLGGGAVLLLLLFSGGGGGGGGYSPPPRHRKPKFFEME